MDTVFRALADDTRRQMLLRLVAGELPASSLGEGFAMTQPAVSQHLKVLREAGLVSIRSVGRQRMYRLRPAAIRAVHDWAARFESFWSQRLDALEDVLDTLSDPEESDG